MSARPLRVAAWVAAFASIAWGSAAQAATEWHVPGDFDDLQEAVDAARAGDEIFVHGGVHETIVIDKALTIVGEPAPDLPLLVGTQEPVEPFVSAITLAGPGAGTVVLAALEVGGTINGFFYGEARAGISGGGFDELRIHDSTVRGPAWVTLTGGAFGAPGIETDVPLVWLLRSEVAASLSEVDECVFGGPSGVAGIEAPASTVVLLDSVVRGGGAGPTYCLPIPECDCLPTGDGGPGLVAARLFRAGSTVLGGVGAIWVDSVGTFCCQRPDGPPLVVAEDLPLATGLAGSGPLVARQPFTLTWDTPGPVAVLFVQGTPAPPWTVPGVPGPLFFGPGALAVVVPAGSPQGLTFTLRRDPALVGSELTFQVFDPALGLTRPVIVLVRPS